MLEEAVACEGDLAMRGRSEAEDHAEINKERRKAVATGSKTRRPRAPRAPRAPRPMKANTNRKFADSKGVRPLRATKSSGKKGSGRKNGVCADAGMGSEGARPRNWPAAETAGGSASKMDGSGEGGIAAYCGADVSGFIDDSDLGPAAPPHYIHSRGEGASVSSGPGSDQPGNEIEERPNQREPSFVPDSTAEYMTQAPLSPDMLPCGDDSGVCADDGSRGGAGDDEKSSSRSSVGDIGVGAITINDAGDAGSVVAQAVGTQGDLDEEPGHLPMAVLERRLPKPMSDASTAEVETVEEGNGGRREGDREEAGSCTADELTSILRAMGVRDVEIIKPEGRGDLEDLLKAARGDPARAVGMFFEREKDMRGKEKVWLCLWIFMVVLMRAIAMRHENHK